MANEHTTPPALNDLEAEQNVIGCCVAEAGIALSLAELGLESRHFASDKNAAIFAGICAMVADGRAHADGPVSVSLLRPLLREQGDAELAERPDLYCELVPTIASFDNAAYFAKAVMNFARRRALAEQKTRELAAVYDLSRPLPEDQSAGALTRCLGDVAPEAVTWLWPGRIPAGKLTILSGDPGLGKSFLTIDLAARVSRGMPWPDSDCAADTREEG
jgi:hypothetical protein